MRIITLTIEVIEHSSEKHQQFAMVLINTFISAIILKYLSNNKQTKQSNLYKKNQAICYNFLHKLFGSLYEEIVTVVCW